MFNCLLVSAGAADAGDWPGVRHTSPLRWASGFVAPFLFYFRMRQAKLSRCRLCHAEIRSSMASGSVPSTAYIHSPSRAVSPSGLPSVQPFRLPSDSAFLGCLLQLS